MRYARARREQSKENEKQAFASALILLTSLILLYLFVFDRRGHLNSNLFRYSYYCSCDRRMGTCCWHRLRGTHLQVVCGAFVLLKYRTRRQATWWTSRRCTPSRMTRCSSTTRPCRRACSSAPSTRKLTCASIRMFCQVEKLVQALFRHNVSIFSCNNRQHLPLLCSCRSTTWPRASSYRPSTTKRSQTTTRGTAQRSIPAMTSCSVTVCSGTFAPLAPSTSSTSSISISLECSIQTVLRSLSTQKWYGDMFCCLTYSLFVCPLCGILYWKTLRALFVILQWDVRTFHLLHTVAALDHCELKFNRSGSIMYAWTAYSEDEHADMMDSDLRFRSRIHNTFRTFDAKDYSHIGTLVFLSVIFLLKLLQLF